MHDNGIGLTPEQRALVFERFYQASSSSEGAGVGLSICARAAQAMGGAITIDSEGLGKGCTAAVRLVPVAGEPPAATKRETAAG
jgi:signal transduction histidine kinase